MHILDRLRARLAGKDPAVVEAERLIEDLIAATVADAVRTIEALEAVEREAAEAMRDYPYAHAEIARLRDERMARLCRVAERNGR